MKKSISRAYRPPARCTALMLSLRLPPQLPAVGRVGILAQRCLFHVHVRRPSAVQSLAHVRQARTFASKIPPDVSSASASNNPQTAAEPPLKHAPDTTVQDTVYHGPLTKTFRRLKIFSLSSLTLTFVMAPFIMVLETSSRLPVVGRLILVGVALSTSGVSTALVAWCGRPYVTTLRWIEPEALGAGSGRAVEMTTLTLALRERITRVYDTAFFVPAGRPFATWELASAFQLPKEEAELERSQGTLPREETIAETMTNKKEVIGRWIVRWDENGRGVCRQVGQVVRYVSLKSWLNETLHICCLLGTSMYTKSCLTSPFADRISTH